ncbi:DHHW family protein [uncultured Ruthenibacterium sp.]|uniref:DHHW family protein n=1 Tax=uncultured Ruthenibacterium sp. TaxID=1905347 RepID=UPI00349E49F3
MNIIHKIRQYPIVFLFLAFLIGFAILDELWPKREYSELENRKLAQRPTFTISSVLEENPNNTWMSQYDKYTKDQVAFRDGWIDLKSRIEALFLKTENNDVWLGQDHYLFAKFLSLGESTRFYQNLSAIEKLCERHPDMVDVMIVPSASLILEDKLPYDAPVANEDLYLDELAATLSGKASVYDERETLRQHQDEYIYYRTDHHWTDNGAYYAYQDYIEGQGLTPVSHESLPLSTVDNFYGTNYSKARTFNAIPDTITYPDLNNILTIHNFDPLGNETLEPGPLYDTSAFSTRDKYSAFLRGNNGYSTLEGNGEGSILVVKDSYANSFIPYLTQNYRNIGIVDFRANNEKIDSILERGNYERILILYSFQGFASDIYLASRIAVA